MRSRGRGGRPRPVRRRGEVGVDSFQGLFSRRKGIQDCPLGLLTHFCGRTLLQAGEFPLLGPPPLQKTLTEKVDRISCLPRFDLLGRDVLLGIVLGVSLPPVGSKLQEGDPLPFPGPIY